MDPIDAITKITSGVLRRIADAIDAAPTAEPPVTIHIETLHVHPTETTTAPHRNRMGVPRMFGRS